MDHNTATRLWRMACQRVVGVAGDCCDGGSEEIVDETQFGAAMVGREVKVGWYYYKNEQYHSLSGDDYEKVVAFLREWADTLESEKLAHRQEALRAQVTAREADEDWVKDLDIDIDKQQGE